MLSHPILRNGMIASVMAIPLIASTAYSALASQLNFKIYNHTAYALRELYVSATSHGEWDNNLLYRGLLPSGYNTQVVFSDPSACYYDIRAVFSDEEVLQVFHVDVCTNNAYHFYQTR